MNSKAGFGYFWFSPRMSPTNDLESWRTGLVNAMHYFAALAFPLSMFATFPVFMRERMYELIALDVGFYLLLIFSLLLKGKSYKTRGYIWIVLVYFMTICFHAALGPHYARPAWLVMTAVMAAFFFGTRAADQETA